jgi:hypothetical protein
VRKPAEATSARGERTGNVQARLDKRSKIMILILSHPKLRRSFELLNADEDVHGLRTPVNVGTDFRL